MPTISPRWSPESEGRSDSRTRGGAVCSPGTGAGGAVMNAGTRRGEMRDAGEAVRMVTPRGHIVDSPASAIQFSYRRARLPGGIVVGVWLQRKPASRERSQTVV